MNDTQRTRILLLLMAGVLLVGGSLLWVNYHREAPDDVAMQQTAQLQAVINRRKHGRSGNRDSMAAEKSKPVDAGATKMALDKMANMPPATTTEQIIGYQSTTAGSAPIAHLSSANSVREKLTKMMVDAGLTPPSNGKPEAAANAVSKMAAINTVMPKRDLAATPMAVAVTESRENAGRKNPFDTVSGYVPFPRAGKAAADSDQENNDLSTEGKPGAKALAQRIKDKVNGKGKSKHNALALVPPPPPVSGSLASGGVSMDELPAPPARPAIADKMKVMAVIGDHVLITFTDQKARLDNNWPKTITLGPGDKFESVSIVKVGDDSVTFDEDGERTVKSVDAIK